MKQGWEIKKLGEVCTIKGRIGFRGYTRNDLVPQGEGAITLSPSNITNDVLLFDKCQYISWSKYEESPEIQIFEGDIIYAKTASVGKVALVKYLPEKATINPQFVVFKEILCNASYLYYAVRGMGFKHQISQITNGVAIPTVSQSNMANLRIPVPERAEQERIVGELDCLSGIIAAKRAQLRELDTLAQSIFYTMFGDPITNDKGWQTKRIKDVFNVKIGPFGSLLHNRDYINGGVPLVNPIHMQNEMIYPDFDFTVSDTKLKELENYILHTNDIIFARRGDIGRCAIVRKTEDGYLCGTGSLYIRPASPIDSIFVVKMIRCSSMIEHLVSLAKGATMLNINCKIIEELNIITPPIDLQKQFAEKIENIERQKELITKSIKETEDLFNSRMDYYFN